MGTSQQFSLRWNNYLKHITSAFDTLRSDEDLVDVTLSCEGKRIRAHKMLLSACSTYFRDLFKENPCQHPVIIFRNVKFDDLAALVDFIYQGEVNVVQEQLDSFMTTAELLAVQGLTDGSRKEDSITEDDVEIPNEPEVQLRNAPGKVVMNNKGSKSPNSPSPYHSSDAKSDPPPNKKRRCRDNADSHSERSKRRAAASPKNPDNGKSDGQPSADPVEIIPLMPNLKLEMPEYLEQDGSSCSYDEHGGDSPSKTIGDGSDIIEDDQKPDITNTFYSNASDTLDASKSSDIGYILSKPGTSSGDRISHEGLGESNDETATPKTMEPCSQHQDPLRQLDSCLSRIDISVTTNAHSSSTSLTAINAPSGELAAHLNSSLNSAVVVGTSGPIGEIRRRSRLMHDEAGRWVCDVCGKTYNRGDSLAHHRSIHRGDTICPICQAVFTRKYTMRCHLANVHGIRDKT